MNGFKNGHMIYSNTIILYNNKKIEKYTHILYYL